MASFGNKGQNKNSAPSVSHAYVGDEVYFHLNGEPVAGSVVSVGKHGCTIQHEKKHHKVKWEKISGHKKRVQQRYTVVERGEDGMIVADTSGKKRYVHIPPEARGEKLQVTK